MGQKILRWPVILSLMFILGLAGFLSYSYYLQEIKVEPEELIVQALDKTNQAASYRFHIEAHLISADNKITLSNLIGERSSDGGFYIKGEMTGQEIEVYQVENSTYFRDFDSERWMVTPGNSPLDLEKYMVEINPLSIIKITQANDLQYLGRQRKVPGRPYLLTCRPWINNQFLNSYWHDFYYQLWVERGSKYIIKVSIEAIHRQNPQDKLLLTVDFYDLNKRIKIKPPQ